MLFSRQQGLNSPSYTKVRESLRVVLRTCFIRHGKKRPSNGPYSYLTEQRGALLMSLVSRAVLASVVSLKREAHSALSRFELLGPRRNSCPLPVRYGFRGRTHLLDRNASISVLSLQSGGVLYEPSCPVSRLLTRGETHN